jgi:hypothetical protein
MRLFIARACEKLLTQRLFQSAAAGSKRQMGTFIGAEIRQQRQ